MEIETDGSLGPQEVVMKVCLVAMTPSIYTLDRPRLPADPVLTRAYKNFKQNSLTLFSA